MKLSTAQSLQAAKSALGAKWRMYLAPWARADQLKDLYTKFLLVCRKTQISALLWPAAAEELQLSLKRLISTMTEKDKNTCNIARPWAPFRTNSPCQFVLASTPSHRHQLYLASYNEVEICGEECHAIIWGTILEYAWQDWGKPQPVPELNSETTLSLSLITVPTIQLLHSVIMKWCNCPTSLKCSLYWELPNPNTANFMPLSNSFSTLKSLDASSSHLQNQAAVSGGLPSVYVGNMNTHRLFPDVWKYKHKLTSGLL